MIYEKQQQKIAFNLFIRFIDITSLCFWSNNGQFEVCTGRFKFIELSAYEKSENLFPPPWSCFAP